MTSFELLLEILVVLNFSPKPTRKNRKENIDFIPKPLKENGKREHLNSSWIFGLSKYLCPSFQLNNQKTIFELLLVFLGVIALQAQAPKGKRKKRTFQLRLVSLGCQLFPEYFSPKSPVEKRKDMF
eukprot:4432206-Amphidinium_carterae.1